MVLRGSILYKMVLYVLQRTISYKKGSISKQRTIFLQRVLYPNEHAQYLRVMAFILKNDSYFFGLESVFLVGSSTAVQEYLARLIQVRLLLCHLTIMYNILLTLSQCI